MHQRNGRSACKGNGASRAVVSGYTCSDLFWQTKLLDEAEAALSVIEEVPRQVDALIAVGMPLSVAGKLLNVAAVLVPGEGIGLRSQGEVACI